MRLVLVHDWLVGLRGGEKCLEPLCRRFPDARLFTLVHRPGATAPAIERLPITTSFLQRLPGATRHYRWLLPLMPPAVERLRIPADVDLVLSFSHAVAKGVRPPPGVPHVCYCFTPMRYAWHLREDYFGAAPAWRAGGVSPLIAGDEPPPEAPLILHTRVRGKPLAAVRDLLLDRVRDWDRRTADRVTAFVASSRTVAQRIRECYGRESVVIYPPVDVDFYTPDGEQREDYYLCVSALVPYKRLDVAIAAANLLRRRLVVIGAGPERARLAALAGPTVTLHGWQSDEVIRQHFRRCRALLFPGTEDFGIVPVEAQACGAPVIAFGQGGATETVLPPRAGQPGTGLFFQEQSAVALAEAVLRLEADRNQCCPDLARRHAEQFNAPRYERELVAYLDLIVARRLASSAAHAA